MDCPSTVLYNPKWIEYEKEKMKICRERSGWLFLFQPLKIYTVSLIYKIRSEAAFLNLIVSLISLNT